MIANWGRSLPRKSEINRTTVLNLIIIRESVIYYLFGGARIVSFFDFHLMTHRWPRYRVNFFRLLCPWCQGRPGKKARHFPPNPTLSFFSFMRNLRLIWLFRLIVDGVFFSSLGFSLSSPQCRISSLWYCSEGNSAFLMSFLGSFPFSHTQNPDHLLYFFDNFYLKSHEEFHWIWWRGCYCFHLKISLCFFSPLTPSQNSCFDKNLICFPLFLCFLEFCLL